MNLHLLPLAPNELGWAGRTTGSRAARHPGAAPKEPGSGKDHAIRTPNLLAPACSTLKGLLTSSPLKLAFAKSWPLLAMACSEHSI